MFNRAQVKANAKAALKGNLGLSIVVILVIGVLIGIASATVIGAILLVGPLSAGLVYFFMKLYRKQTVGINDSFSGFSNFSNNMVAGILVAVYTFLWTLLFFIPGIIKQFSYSMTYFILNDHPEYTATQAITESRRMMKGHKGELFVLYLSFLGWDLLSVLTLGILEIVYVAPYKAAAVAGFYESIKG